MMCSDRKKKLFRVLLLIFPIANLWPRFDWRTGSASRGAAGVSSNGCVSKWSIAVYLKMVILMEKLNIIDNHESNGFGGTL